MRLGTTEPVCHDRSPASPLASGFTPMVTSGMSTSRTNRSTSAVAIASKP